VLRTLHNPRYAGAFVYGRRRARKTADGKITHESVPREQWTTLIPEAHPGYLSFEQFEHNQRVLAANARAHGAERAAGPASPEPGSPVRFPTQRLTALVHDDKRLLACLGGLSAVEADDSRDLNVAPVAELEDAPAGTGVACHEPPQDAPLTRHRSRLPSVARSRLPRCLRSQTTRHDSR
jgi:hypothetical protein